MIQLRLTASAERAGIVEAAPGIDFGPALAYQLEHERTRRSLCRVIIAIYCLLILEGVVRKWVLPSFHRPLYFIRDPLVAWIYFTAITKGFWPQRSLLLSIGLIFGLVGFVLVIFNLDSIPMLVMAYGWRNCFAYLPLAFIIGEQFCFEDWQRIVRFTVIIAIPIAVLCAIQSVSGATSAVNAGVGSGSDEMFVPLAVGGNVIRACGTFTSGTGQVQFIGSLVVILIWLWSDDDARVGFRRWLLLSAAAATATMLVVGGHRAAFLLLALIVFGGMIISGATLGLKRSLRLIVGIGAILVLVAVGSRYLFNEQATAMVERFQGVSDEDPTHTGGLGFRVVSDFYHFVDFIPIAGLAGNGLGAAGNAGDTLNLNAHIKEAEDDWSRNIMDLGPIFGTLFIVYRTILVVVLVIGAAGASRRYNDMLPALLISFIGITLLYGQITSQGSINGYGWLFAGFCMAANNGRLSRIKASSQEEQARRGEHVSRAALVGRVPNSRVLFAG
jgi:hypothetical protein